MSDQLPDVIYITWSDEDEDGVRYLIASTTPQSCAETLGCNESLVAGIYNRDRCVRLTSQLNEEPAHVAESK